MHIQAEALQRGADLCLLRDLYWQSSTVLSAYWPAAPPRSRPAPQAAYPCHPRSQKCHREGILGMATAQKGGWLTEAATFFAAKKTAVHSWQLASTSFVL